jgi:hypothetical protein
MQDHDLAVLRTLRLKGRASAQDVAAATGLGAAEAGRVLTQLAGSGDVRALGDKFMLLAPGRDRLSALLAQEREGVDRAAVQELYEQFTAVNQDFKALASDWQLRDGEPNDHSDPGYDAAVLSRLGPVHNRVLPILDRVAQQAPRLAPYGARLDSAYVRVGAGEHSWLLTPLIDSYHTVWFELHEELLHLAGLAREAEAALGRAD